MKNKSEQIRNLLEAGNEREALRIAAKFFDRSENTKLYKTAYEGLLNPSFYKQVGVDVELKYTQAIANLKERFLNDNRKKEKSNHPQA